MDINISRRDLRDEAESERYQSAYAEIEAAARAEWDEQFGQEFQKKHPFACDRHGVHEKVMAKLLAE